MKQIDIIKTYAQKRCLIVDDLPDARAQLKRILFDFGAQDIDTVGNAEEAIDNCQKQSYDLVLADYNLGAGKNGQQLLEELRFQELLKHAALFIMITAENAAHYVLHTLEYEPDEFIAKPVNRDGLRPRLDLALLRSEYLKPVKEALDQHNVKKAMGRAELLLETDNRFNNDVRKLLCELYLRNQRIDDAEAICRYFDDVKRPLWSELALGRVHLLRHDFDNAEKTLRSTAQANPYCVEAQDLLSEVYEQSHRMALSQQALQNAVKISPRHAPRQRELGRVSQNIEDEKTAVHAYRAAIRHAKNSCHENPGDMVNLAQSLLKLSIKADPTQAASLIKEAETSLGALDKRYKKHPIVTMRRKLVEAEILSHAGKSDAAEALTNEAVGIHQGMRYSVIENTEKQLCIDCALEFINRGRYDEGEAILQQLARNNTDPDFAIKIDKLLREPQTKEGIAFAAGLNKSGIEHYQKDDIDGAIRSFRQVLQELPNHIGLNLNLIQAYVNRHKKYNLNNAELESLDMCFKRIGQLKSNSSYSERYEYLQKRYRKISTEAETEKS